MRASEPKIAGARERTLQASVRDGACHGAMLGAGETYLSACGVTLNGSPLAIGVLATLPPLLGAIAQALGLFLIETGLGRRTLLVRGAAAQALVWIPIALLAAYAASYGSSPSTLIILIGFVILYYSLAGLISPAWNSLMGDTVSPAHRGSYFGNRSRLAGLATFLGMIGAGQFLHLFEGRSNAQSLRGFVGIFIFAALARSVSSYFLSRHHDLPYHRSQENHFSFWQFIARAPRSNFAKFVFFVSSVNCAVAISGPFFALYELRVLGFSFLQFTVISAASFLAQFFALQHWGNLSDRFGNKKILNICAFGVAANPLLWLVTASTWGLVLVQMYGGFVWAGFNLASVNFMFDAVSPPKRARCAAYQAIINGSFVFAGSLIGAQLSGHRISFLPALTWLPVPSSPYLCLFAISGLMRLLAALVFLPKVSEVRPVERIRHRELIIEIVHIRPTTGATFAILGGGVRRWRKDRPENG